MPSLKDRIKAFGKRKKPPTPTKPDHKGFITAIREHIKTPPLTRPDFKGCIKVVKKTVKGMFQCVKRQKDEDDCQGLPEVKISYADEEIPESLASRSRISLTDSESDDCPAEADLGPRSDSLEGIPEILEAESLPSLMENEEEKEAAWKGKDWEKDLGRHDPSPTQAEPNPGPASDSLPQPQVTDAEASPETTAAEGLSSSTESEAGPGPSSGRVPEPQGRTSDESHSDREPDLNNLNNPNYSLTEEDLHLMCDMFPTCPKETKRSLADGIASKYLDLMLEHFLKSEETACNDLMYAVFASHFCNLDTCMNEFIVKLNENQIEDSEELPLAKLKALRGIRAIIKDHSDIQSLKDWLQFHFVTLAHVLANEFQPKEPGTSRKVKKYIVPGEAIDIFVILLLRLDLVHRMKSKLCTR